jgi:hypothetical protein
MGKKLTMMQIGVDDDAIEIDVLMKVKRANLVIDPLTY